MKATITINREAAIMNGRDQFGAITVEFTPCCIPGELRGLLVQYGDGDSISLENGRTFQVKSELGDLVVRFQAPVNQAAVDPHDTVTTNLLALREQIEGRIVQEQTKRAEAVQVFFSDPERTLKRIVHEGSVHERVDGKSIWWVRRSLDLFGVPKEAKSDPRWPALLEQAEALVEDGNARSLEAARKAAADQAAKEAEQHAALGALLLQVGGDAMVRRWGEGLMPEAELEAIVVNQIVSERFERIEVARDYAASDVKLTADEFEAFECFRAQVSDSPLRVALDIVSLDDEDELGEVERIKAVNVSGRHLGVSVNVYYRLA